MLKSLGLQLAVLVMSDILSDMKQRAFINIIAYSPGGAIFMRSIDVSQERKTGFFSQTDYLCSN